MTVDYDTVTDREGSTALLHPLTIERMLVELDPRNQPEVAVRRARRVANATGADVDLLVWEQLNLIPGGVILDNVAVDAVRDEYIADLRDWAQEAAEPLRDDNIRVTVHTAWQNPRYDAVLSCAQERSSDLVMRVAGRRGRIERLILGATDWELVRRSTVPIWFVRDNDDAVANVLAAVDPVHPSDGSMTLDRRIVRAANFVAETLGSELHVFHACESSPVRSPPLPTAGAGGAMAVPPPRVDPAFEKKVRRLHESKLKELLSPHDLPEERLHVVNSNVGESITTVVDDNGIGIVVAGAVSRSWLDRLLVGSTAETLLSVVDRDLLIVPAR